MIDPPGGDRDADSLLTVVDRDFRRRALASGLLFSAGHLNLGGLIPLALVGMLFAWSYSRTGSLWTPIYAHLIFNLVSFVALTAIVQSGGST